MKRGNRIISIMLAVFMLMGTMTNIAFASSKIATNLSWNNIDIGALIFDAADIDTDYYIRLYKDNNLVDETWWFNNQNEKTINYDKFKYTMADLGKGEYYYTVSYVDKNLNISTTEVATSPTYSYNPPKLIDAFYGIKYDKNTKTLSWESYGDIKEFDVVLKYTYGDNRYYVASNESVSGEKRTFDFSESNAFAYYYDYINGWDGPYYPKKDAKAVIFLYAIPSNRNDYEMSCLKYELKSDEYPPEEGVNNPVEENTFNFTLPDMQGKTGTTLTTDNIYPLIPEDMKSGMYYASNYYEEYIHTPAKFTFSNTTAQREYTQERIPLKCFNFNEDYRLDIPVPGDLEKGVYKLEIDLGVASGKECGILKPYHITINNFTVINEPIATGSCGENATWTLSADGVLTISGTGKIDCGTSTSVWNDYYSYKKQIKKIVIESGITEIGDNALYELFYLEDITIPSTVKTIGYGFLKGSDVKDVIITKGVESINMDWSFIKCQSLNTVTFLNDDIDFIVPYKALLADEYTIKANYGSNAYFFAKENNIAFEALNSESPTVNITVVDSQTLEKISNAKLQLQDSELPNISANASSNANGEATLAAENGTYVLTCAAAGYPTRTVNIEITDANREFTLYMSKNSILNVSTKTTEMTKDEIVKAGIDINSINNKHVYNCVTVLQFTKELNINVPYICADNDVVKCEPIKVKVPTTDDTKGDYKIATIYPVSKDVFLIIHSSTSWLKEMFDIQLLVANSSAIETIENCAATINIPDGLSLATMTEEIGQQSKDVAFDSIAPNGTADHHWYICGDEKGEYYLNGTVTGVRTGGGISENISADFTTQEPINVLAGDAMKLTITAERNAVVGTPYRVMYSLENTSNKTLNDVFFKVLRGKFIEDYNITNITSKPDIFSKEAFEGDIENGFELSASEFKPNEKLSGIFEITFGEGLNLENGTEYILNNMFAFKGEGSTTTIPTELVMTDSVIAHNYDNGTVIKAATCTEYGEIEYKCTDVGCSETKIEKIDPIGHKFGDWFIAKESTCIEKGEMAHTCSNTGCDARETKELSLAEHTWDSGVITKKPTLDETGTKTYTCTVDGCNATKEEEIPKLVLQSVSFATGDITYTYGDQSAIYNKANNDSENGGAITYSSSNEAVATVNNEGKIVILKSGETTITAKAAETDIYAETTASYKLTIRKAALTVTADDVKTYYGDELKPFTFKAVGFVNGENESVLSGDAVYNTEYQPYSKVGEYSLNISGLSSENYDITYRGGKIIANKAIDYRLSLENLNHKFPEVSEATASLVSPLEDDTAQIVIEYQLTDGTWTSVLPTEAGNYPIRAYLSESENIAISGKKDDLTDTFVIKPTAMVSLGDTSLNITSNVSGTNVEFSIPDDAIETITQNIPSTGEVIIDATGSTEGVNNITLPTNIVKAMSEATNAKSFTVSADDAEITLDKAALNKISDNVTDTDNLSMHIEAVNKSNLNEQQITALDAIAADATVLQLNMTVVHEDSTTDELHDLGGNVSVKAAYSLPENMRSKKIIVCYVSDDGSVTYLRAIYSDGFVYFTTNHFSTYAIAAVTCTHEWNEGTVITEATTTTTGLKHYTCIICGETKNEIIPVKTSNHSGGSIGGGGGGGGVSSYTVKFETNGGNTIKTVNAKRNAIITEPATPTKDGYSFDGWYSDKELTTKFDFTTKITKSINLYAKWAENAVKTSTIILTIGQKSASINGETKENDVAPKIVNDRTMLPIRFIAETLGAKVDWTQETQTVTISAENTLISLVIGENFATVNGEKIELDSPSFIENDRTYLPLRFVSEKLGAKVEWNETDQTVTITK